MKIKRMVTNAMLIAMYVVLSLFSINLGNMKITLDSFPIIVGAALFGPLDGLIIGFLGSFLNQLLFFGFTPTTLLWVAPAAVRGLLIGFYAKRHQFCMSFRQTQFITISTALLVTLLNTCVMFLCLCFWRDYPENFYGDSDRSGLRLRFALCAQAGEKLS